MSSAAKGRSLLLALMLLVSSVVSAQETAVSAETTEVPRLVSYSGSLNTAAVGPATVVGVTFAIYKDQNGGSPLWLETQNVRPNAKGNYMVQLGANSSQGLPLDAFASGEARWLGVRINGGEEQPRVLLLSVPYALKAADAQTLDGLHASAFVLATPANSGSSAGAESVSSPNAFSATQPPATGSTPVTTAGGTGGKMPLWDSTSDITNSIITQTGNGSSAKIGINITNPRLTLDVNGGELVRGLFEIATTGFATAAKGFISNPLNLESSAFNSSTTKYTLNHFQWQAEPVGNNTTTPGATLNLLYGTDPNLPAETGLSINSKGIFTFALGQTFPGGGGTVTSVGLSAPTSDFTVSGSPVTTSGMLGLNWTVSPTNAATANAIVKRDANGAFSAGEIAATATDDHPALSGTSTNSFGIGVFGSAPGGSAAASTGVSGQGWIGVSGNGSNVGVSGTSTGSTGVSGNGPVTGVAGGGGNYGVTGSATGAGSVAVGVYGTAPSSTEGIGVYGSSIGTGVYGSGGDSGIGVSGSSSTGTGVVGTSTTGNAMLANGNTQQSRTAGGWVKAMVFINGLTPPYNIVRCFNSTLIGSAATTPPCGFTMTELYTGTFIIDFGFEVDDRFYASSLEGLNTNAYGDPVHLMIYPYTGGTGEDPSTLVVTAIDPNTHLSSSTNFAAFVIIF